jgi:hypothetical protein
MKNTIETTCPLCRRELVLPVDPDCPSDCMVLAKLVVCDQCAARRGPPAPTSPAGAIARLRSWLRAVVGKAA